MKTFAQFVTESVEQIDELTGKGSLGKIDIDNFRASWQTKDRAKRLKNKEVKAEYGKAADHYALKSSVAKHLGRLADRRGHVDKYDPDDRPEGRLEGMKKTMKKYRDSRTSSRSGRKMVGEPGLKD